MPTTAETSRVAPAASASRRGRRARWRRRVLLVALLAVPAAVSAAGAEPPPPLLDALSAPPAAALPRLSPDGSHVALVRRRGGRETVEVLRVGEAEPRVALSVNEEHVETLAWANDQRLLLGLRRPGRVLRLLALERDGRAPLRLTPGRARGDRATDPAVVDLLRDDGAHVLLALDGQRPWTPDVVRLNVYTGERRVVERNEGRTYRWRTDRSGAVRLRSDWGDDGGTLHFRHAWRRPGERDWRPLRAFALGDPALVPLAFAADGRTLIVAAERADDSLDLHRYDPGARRFLEPVFERAGVDLGELRFSAVTGAPAVVDVSAARPEQAVLDADWARWHATLDRAEPGATHRVVSVGPADARVVVHSYSDRDPGRFSLLDTRSGALTPLAERMPGIDPGQMRETAPIRFSARDGLSLEGYWTAPSRGSGPAPAVLYVHGGPWARDRWGFDPMVQWLAANGFGVLQVNFRGSRGYGRALLMAGQREWGGAMQHDLEDAVDWAVRRGLVDEERVCVAGASYGGYAALMAVLRRPERFACAVAQAPVTDPAAIVEGFGAAGNLRAAAEWRTLVGEGAALAPIAPLRLAAGLERPVLLVHGRDDPTVPLAQSERFARAAGERARLLVLEGEGHRIAAPGARRAWFAAVAAFLRERLGAAGAGP